jgi:DNA-binding NtrC family response regulator
VFKVLIVDDDDRFRIRQADWVEREGCESRAADSLAAARAELREYEPDLILLDLELADGSGLDLLDPERSWDAEIVVVTGHATVETAVAALRRGVTDYLTKPLDRARLKATLASVMRTRALKREVGTLRSELRSLGRFGPLIGSSQAMQRVYDLVARVAPTDAPVLVTGDSGTGKELVARAVHDMSARRDGPFIAVNCGAIAPTLLESELFGHERGSFTGAERARPGMFERASGGTLLLDEITEMPLEAQVRLLRVLESHSVQRLGGDALLPVDVRVVSATNRDPSACVAEGRLREDLLYRISVFPIPLPPLRHRGRDVELLAQAFLERLNREHGTTRRLTGGALDALRKRQWPGNVRELRNAVQRAFILAGGDLDENVFSPDGARAAETPEDPFLRIRVGTPLDDAVRRLILATLERCGGNRTHAAAALGISPKTLYNRLKAYRI